MPTLGHFLNNFGTTVDNVAKTNTYNKIKDYSCCTALGEKVTWLINSRKIKRIIQRTITNSTAKTTSNNNNVTQLTLANLLLRPTVGTVPTV